MLQRNAIRRVLSICSYALLAVLITANPGFGQNAQLRLGDGSTPSRAYFGAIQQLYRGDYRNAERTFRRELNGGIKIGVTNRWIDSICYHAMYGEFFYHQGRPDLALEQFDLACSMYLQYPQWMLRVDFKTPRPDENRLNQQRPPWGTSVRKFRLGKFSDQMLIRQGELNPGQRVLSQGGGVVNPAQFWRIDVIEVVRANALAISRRNELLGPLAQHDAISRDLVAKLSQGGAPPNHWSNAWVDLQLGVAYRAQGKDNLAMQRLQRAERIAGEYDHPLTCVALLEQGRISMEAGNLEQAQQLFADASISAFYYENAGVVDESFRLLTICRLAQGISEVNPALAPAIVWARRENLDHIYARLCLALADESMAIGDWQNAQAALNNGQAGLRKARQGLLVNQSYYLAARLLLQKGDETAHDAFHEAIQAYIGMSSHNLQLILANARFDSRQLQARSAVNVYQELLDDPKPVDWVFWPLESQARLITPHFAAFDRWLASIPGRDSGKLVEVTDLAKRHRYLQTLPWGGRLASLRDVLEAPEQSLGQNARGQRNELLIRFPEYAELKQLGEEYQSSIKGDWKPDLAEREKRELWNLLKKWDNNLQQRENLLDKLGTQRVPVDIRFPEIVPSDEIQASLMPGQAVLMFHDTDNGIFGFLITSKAMKSWDCGPQNRMSSLLSSFLRDLGNYDANNELSADDLTSQEWLESGAKLYEALLKGSSIDPESMTDLLIVPDGLTWYVPWSAMPVKTEQGEIKPLFTFSKIRIAPTLGIAFSSRIPVRRTQHTGIAGSGIVPGDTEEQVDEALAAFKGALENPILLDRQNPVPNPIVSSLVETLVVLDESELELSGPLEWSPVPQGRKSRNASLNDWLNLPQFGPQRIILPATRTIAERGGKVSRRKSKGNSPPGSELFLASCGLISTGAQTILLSQWRVGGESTMEIIREFLQELPHTSAADAWQRSVQLVRELPIEPAIELRVKAGKDDPEVTAAHPLFWAGYTLIDVSKPPIDDKSLTADAKPDPLAN